MMKISTMSFILSLFCASCGLFAEGLKLPSVFSDHMVLQRELPLPVWGQAEAGAEVRVAFREQTRTTTADAAGNWRVDLAPESASFEPAELRVQSGDSQRVIQDVLVGEVWFCSGQSNMDWQVRRTLDGDLEPLVHAPAIRLLRAKRVVSATALWDNGAVWTAATPETIAGFSSVGWHFGRTLQGVLNVPVGLIDSAWGGTPAIAWSRPVAMGRHPLLQARWDEWEAGMPSFAQKKAEWEAALAAWQAENGVAPAAFNPRQHPNAPKPPPFDPASPHRPASLANGMVSPFIPFAMRGVIWYQGESDAGWNPQQYGERLQVMFEDWREAWGLPNLYVGIVQLANFMVPKVEPADDPWPQLREAQRQFSLNLHHSGMAVTIDLGEEKDIHPRNKQAVGRRLARLALADAYGLEVLRGGPIPDKVEWQENGELRIQFRQNGSKLISFDRELLGGFTLAGEDGVFHPANAEILSASSVRVHSEAVLKPVHLRYAWQNNPADASLFNEERIPASPFELRKHDLQNGK
jgi:sialate O-acetylesterase